MAPTFFAQLAAGCLLVVGLSDILNSGWKYVRLMVLASIALAAIAVFLVAHRDVGPATDATPVAHYSTTLGDIAPSQISMGSLIAGIVIATFGMAFMKFTDPNITRLITHRVWLGLAGAACLVGTSALILRPDVNLPGARFTMLTGGAAVLAILTTALGAWVLGGVTAGMLLGHRYLTDTDMPIAPLRRLTNIYLIALVARLIWAAALAWPIFSDTFRPSGGALWFWVVLTIRGGVGLIGAAIFAWMIRDCVKSRATQSATAIFYLSMVFVYLGELAAQYLLRTEGLAI